MRTGVYRQEVGELEFTDRKLKTGEFIDRKQKNKSLQVESRRTGVKLTDRKQERTRFYRQKVGKLQFTDRKWENWSLQIYRKKDNQSLQTESRKTRVYRQKV